MNIPEITIPLHNLIFASIAAFTLGVFAVLITQRFIL